MGDVALRVAKVADLPILQRFYVEAYGSNHPLTSTAFWHWQYGDAEHGRAFIAVENGHVVAHLGCSYDEGYSWMMNAFVVSSHRGTGLIQRLYDCARPFAPLVTTNANPPAIAMYRKMGWYRYADLERFVSIRPGFHPSQRQDFIAQTEVEGSIDQPSGSHYWRQPGLNGIVLEDGSSGVIQASVGGLRLVDIVDPDVAVREAWARGFLWTDYVTSWNDPVISKLRRGGWLTSDASPIPWRLNPVIWDEPFHITWLSEKPVRPDLIVRRSFCDHGRIGSIQTGIS